MIDQQREKQSLLQAKDINKYIKKTDLAGSTNPVSLMSKPNKHLKETFHFFKENASAINEIQSYIAAIYGLLLGTVDKTKPDYVYVECVGKTKPVFSAEGIRVGTVSPAIEGFQSIDDYLKGLNIIDWDAFTELLVKKGYGKFAAADIFYQDPDAHWKNMGFNILKELVKIDLEVVHLGLLL